MLLQSEDDRVSRRSSSDLSLTLKKDGHSNCLQFPCLKLVLALALLLLCGCVVPCDRASSDRSNLGMRHSDLFLLCFWHRAREDSAHFEPTGTYWYIPKTRIEHTPNAKSLSSSKIKKSQSKLSFLELVPS